MYIYIYIYIYIAIPDKQSLPLCKPGGLTSTLKRCAKSKLKLYMRKGGDSLPGFQKRGNDFSFKISYIYMDINAV